MLRASMRDLLRRIRSLGINLNSARWLWLGAVVGVLCGLAAVAFYAAIDLGAHVLMVEVAGWQQALPAGEAPLLGASERTEAGGLRWWWLLVALCAGGMLSGWLTSRFAPEARGAGTGAAVAAFHQHHGEMSRAAPLTKWLASVVTLSSGGSAGREGPIAMVGAGLASWFGGRLKLTARDRRILLAAGIGGGVAAMFRAPLAGALFAAEVLYSDPEFEADVLIPSFISAIVAHVTFGLVESVLFPTIDVSVLFAVPQELGVRFTAGDTPQLLGFLLVVAVVVGFARVFIRALDVSERRFDLLPLPRWLVAGIGALAAGVVALVLLAMCIPLVRDGSTEALATLGAGYGIIQQAIDGLIGYGGWSAVLVLVIVATGKMVTTCLTVGSGGSGGAFGPSIVIGGCLGGAIGIGLDQLGGPLAAIAPDPVHCIIMGMAGFLAACYKVPIAGLLMVTEMTGSYELLLPAMWVCAMCYLFSGKRSVVPSQVASPIDSPAHRGHFFSDILAGIRVEKVFDPDREVRTLQPHSSIDEAKTLVTETNQNVYPVVDAESGRPTGLFTLDDLRAFLYDDVLGLVAVAQDVAGTDFQTVTVDDSLATALRHFTERNLDELPVVDPDSSAFIGLLSRRQVIASYNAAVDDMRAQRQRDGWDDNSKGRPAV